MRGVLSLARAAQPGDHKLWLNGLLLEGYISAVKKSQKFA